MSNIDTVNELLTAINSTASTRSRRTTRRTSSPLVPRADPPRLGVRRRLASRILRDYADCNYTDLEYIEDGDHVAVRATIEARATTGGVHATRR
jgi:hypothetical protein